MNDAYHLMGGDLAVSSTGDIRLASGSDAGQQRVLRRLLTNPGDYLWQLNYGAGVPRQVGENTTANGIGALIRGQMLLEQGVSQNPEPAVTVATVQGGVSCSVRYNDAPNGNTQSLVFNVTN